MQLTYERFIDYANFIRINSKQILVAENEIDPILYFNDLEMMGIEEQYVNWRAEKYFSGETDVSYRDIPVKACFDPAEKEKYLHQVYLDKLEREEKDKAKKAQLEANKGYFVNATAYDRFKAWEKDQGKE